jgi:hypothetical protein
VRPVVFYTSSYAFKSRHTVNTQTSRVLSTPKLFHNCIEWLRSQLPDLDFKDLLPLGFEGLNGGIVIGNPATPNVLVAEFSRMDGMFGTVPVCRFAISCVPPNHSYNCSSQNHP